jgi:hypothetical protein
MAHYQKAAVAIAVSLNSIIFLVEGVAGFKLKILA